MPDAPAAQEGRLSTDRWGVLAAYGWDAAWEAELTRSGSQTEGLVPGRVARADRGRCEVVTEDARLRRATLPTAPLGSGPCVGDWVALRREPVTATSGQDTLSMAHILPRRTVLTRSSASGRSDPQLLAANIDIVAIAVPLTARVNPGRLERMVALAWESGAEPLVVLTKADEVGGAEARAVETAEADVAASAPGVPVVTTSAADGTGLEALAAQLTGTTVVLGASGAGKSTLVNALLGSDVQKVGPVRAADGRGRHTTVRRELLPLPGGGALIDTPGLRAVGLWAAEDGLSRTFADIEDLADGCRFADCEHRTEPGCAVLAAVDAGTLPGRRLESYRRLLREQAYQDARVDARLRADQQRVWKARSREQRRQYRERGR